MKKSCLMLSLLLTFAGVAGKPKTNSHRSVPCFFVQQYPAGYIGSRHASPESWEDLNAVVFNCGNCTQVTPKPVVFPDTHLSFTIPAVVNAAMPGTLKCPGNNQLSYNYPVHKFW